MTLSHPTQNDRAARSITWIAAAPFEQAIAQPDNDVMRQDMKLSKQDIQRVISGQIGTSESRNSICRKGNYG
ncbi:hypothetical protein [Caulobacter sp. UNC358MFTsu5.1]|uniref:hypothetical protein n=1 Tax=Caulobacter sp. UNC358MFTsu5.1 TaxID=1449049 RepID=UPI0012DDEA21|nr:hypothetical protein [Caulobacter sp. UNC358MFTsu5.1]